MGAEDALQGRRSPMRGAFGQDIDLVGALGAVFAKWLPDDYVDMNALQPLLDKYDATRRLPEPPRQTLRERAPRPPKVEKIDAKAVILKCLEAAPGKTLVLDKLRQAFKNEVGFDLNVKDLAKHTSYKGRGSLGQFLKSIPEIHRPDPNTVALKRVDKSSAFDDQEVEKEVSLKPLAIQDDWEDEPVAAPGAAPKKRGGRGRSGRRRGGRGGGGGKNWRKNGGGGGGGGGGDS